MWRTALRCWLHRESPCLCPTGSVRTGRWGLDIGTGRTVCRLLTSFQTSMYSRVQVRSFALLPPTSWPLGVALPISRTGSFRRIVWAVSRSLESAVTRMETNRARPGEPDLCRLAHGGTTGASWHTRTPRGQGLQSSGGTSGGSDPRLLPRANIPAWAAVGTN
jgi:hypothetical protein